MHRVFPGAGTMSASETCETGNPGQKHELLRERVLRMKLGFRAIYLSGAIKKFAAG